MCQMPYMLSNFILYIHAAYSSEPGCCPAADREHQPYFGEQTYKGMLTILSDNVHFKCLID